MPSNIFSKLASLLISVAALATAPACAVAEDPSDEELRVGSFDGKWNVDRFDDQVATLDTEDESMTPKVPTRFDPDQPFATTLQTSDGGEDGVADEDGADIGELLEQLRVNGVLTRK